MHEICDNNLQVIYQLPPAAPRGVLFIAHEGNGSPLTYWEPHVQRPNCTGIPDHVSIVKNALSNRFAVVATKSVKSFWQDWPPQASVDAHNVKSFLASWISQHGLERVPLVGFGSNSGANFLSMLALTMSFHSLVLMVSPGLQKAFERASADKYPPVLFVHMPKDHVTASRVHQHTHLLQTKGVPVAEISCTDFPVNPFYFSNNISGFGSDASSKLYAIMQTEGTIDSFGRVLCPPTVSDIHYMFRKYDVLPLQREDERYITLLSERVHSLVKVANGRHAVTSRKCSEIFTWLERTLWGQPVPRVPQSSAAASPAPPVATTPTPTPVYRLPFSKFHSS